MHSLGIVQWDSTRWDHPGYPGRVCGTGPVTRCLEKCEITTVLEFDEIRRGS